MSATGILNALKAILPVGTNISTDSVFVQKGLDPAAATWPAIVLNIPLSDDEQVTLGPPGVGLSQTVHIVHVMYLDEWQVSNRSYEDLMEATETQVARMRANVRSNPSLTIDGIDNCLEVRHIQKRMPSPLDKGLLGFPAIQAQLILWIVDNFENFLPYWP